MTYAITIETARSQPLAAVRVRVPIGGVAGAWRPALDTVWTFLRTHPELKRPGGHNVFVYHHPANRNDPMDVDFGVQAARTFGGEGDVISVETPSGEVAATTHVGPYSQLRAAHDAIHAWVREHGRQIGGMSWETYGDWSDDESKLETTIRYLLR